MSGPQNDSDQDVAAVGNPDLGSGQVPLLALRRREAARALGIGERLLWSLTKAGHIPHCRFDSPVGESVSGVIADSYEGGQSDDTSSGTSRMQSDPDLAAVIDAWPDLPDAVKAGIVAMVGAAKGAGR